MACLQTYRNRAGRAMAAKLLATPCLLMLVCLLFACPAHAQNCNSNTPQYTIDMSGNPDSVWSSPSVSRRGQCCGVSNPDRCIYFKITLDSNAYGLRLDISGGNGGTTYTIGCSGSYSAGSVQCLTGTGPFEISLCKPGNNPQVYTITSISKPSIDTVAYLTQLCPAQLKVKGLDLSTITWASISGSQYNSNLNCTAACSTNTVTYNGGYPSYVDYVVCGTPLASCLGTSWCDTVRVYKVNGVTAIIDPNSPVICYNATTATLTATATGSQPPYTYLWSTGATTQSITVGQGSYWVKVTDANNCSYDYDTTPVSRLNAPVVLNAGTDTTICASVNRVSLLGSYSGAPDVSWAGGTGLFLPDRNSGAATYIPSQDEIDAGYVWLELSPNNTGACPYARDSVKVTIRPAPSPSISGQTTGCVYTGGFVFSTPATAGSSYNWKVLGGSITSGQNTNSIVVKWDSAGPGFVYVEETNAYGCYGFSGNNPISKFDFNTNPIGNATTGPDALSYDSDEYSEGQGVTVKNNCGGGKGADLTLPGSIYDRGKLCMAFSFKRKENFADFFTRGDLRFYITGGILHIMFSVEDGSGGKTTIGPLSTGYTVPQDNQYHAFTFCYDSSSGQARLYVDTALLYAYQGAKGRSLYWTGAGNAVMATVMDGSCSNVGYLDWANIATPISILDLPTDTLVGADTVCEGSLQLYDVGTESGYSYQWSIDGGAILTDSALAAVTVRWTQVGNKSISLTKTNTTTQCAKEFITNVTVLAKPPSTTIIH